MDLLILLIAYIVFFSIIHSLTAAKSFKKAAYKYVSSEKYRILYSILSVITVLPILVLWFIERSSSPILYIIGFPFYFISLFFMGLGVLLLLNSLILIDPLDFIGLKDVLKIKKNQRSTGLSTKGAYGITRHPLYLGGMLFLWFNPFMRLVDLMVTLFFSLYFIFGSILEERKLEEEFGDKYREYKQKVSMFIPFKWFKGLIGL